MKLHYQTRNNRLKVEFDASNLKDAFRQLAEFQEIFDERSCGACKSENLRFIVRTVDSNDFYELKCLDCAHKLAFGQHKVGDSIFPKRKANGATTQGGWHRYVPEKASA